MFRKFIGDKAFYRRVMAIALPIILQNLITNFVSLLDNVMVGQLSTAQISAVTIVNNNLLFVFNLCMFGGAAGAGIFTTQFYGSQNNEGVRHTFRFKLLISLLLTVLGAALFFFGGDSLIGLYLQGEGDPATAADTLYYGRQYMRIMLLGLLPFGLTNAYAGTLRECGHPTVPMLAGFAAMIVNIVFNYVLIFGNFGAPALGVQGAAIATVMARFTELAIVVGWTHLHKEKCPYVKGLYKSFHIPGKLFKSIVLRGMPLLVNECLWSTGMAVLNQSYSYCGLDVVPALSIAFTINNLASVVYHSLGNTVGILTGQMLGAGRPDEVVKDHNRKLTALCTLSGAVFGLIAIALSGVFPLLYNTTDSVRLLASRMILIMGVIMPFPAYIFPVYFTLRAGGKTLSTFLFDCGSVWLITIPLAYCLSRFTSLPILVIFTLCNATDIVKAFVGYFMVRRGDWIQNLTTK